MYSSPSSSAEQAKQALGRRLRELRVEAGLTGRALALLLGCHSAKVSRIEHGRQLPSAADIEAWCAHAGVRDEAPNLVASMRAVEGTFVEWRRIENSGMRHAQESVVPLWERTTKFRFYSSCVVPGPLQTRAYVRALLTALGNRRAVPDHDLDDAVDVRVDKQRSLYAGDHSFAVVLEEGVLRHSIGGAATMVAQLDHLLALTAVPSLALGVIPFDADRSNAWPVESFFMFDNDEVTVELVSGHLRITQPHEIQAHAEMFAELTHLAVHGAKARALITSAIAAVRSDVVPD